MRRDKGVGKAVECVKKCSDGGSLADCFVECYLNGLLDVADEWVRILLETGRRLVELYGFKTILYSREFRSFVISPRRHLAKKLFIYTHDYMRGRIGIEEYAAKSMMAVNTSLRTNLRTLYQNWAIMALLITMYREGSVIVFPEHMILSLERSGKQRLRWIPPNLVVDYPGHGSLSFFIEAPRPLAWGDSGDLSKIWGLYTALRPDMMVYGGRVLDMLEPDRSPPIKKPDVIIEFKELPDWYKRKRDVKGPLARPLSAEEWRNRWIQGLWDGLADVLGISRREAMEKIRSRRGVLLDEVRVVQLYRSVYNPRRMFLVSKHRVPDEIRERLEGHDIVVVDDVGFDVDRLEGLGRELLEHAVLADEYVIRVRDKELAEILSMIKELWEKRLLDLEKIRRLLVLGMREEATG